jgi:8-oxo-dGTP pyrophosphatase MutT (NUDIX family)
MTPAKVVALDSAQFSVAAWTWPFARDRRAEIDAHFARRRQQSPALWNGRVLLLRDFALDGRHLRGTFFETGFADLMAWRDWGFPDASVTNCFAMGALRTSDGTYILGVMGDHTANAGSVYFPSGTPEPSDIKADGVDLEGSAMREVAEETGLTASDFTAQPGWVAVFAPPKLALMKLLQLNHGIDDVRARVLRFLAGERNPELAGVRVVRSRRDFGAEMPAFMTAFLSEALAD